MWGGVFFFNDTATTEIYTLSLHDALPISFTIFEVTPLGVILVIWGMIYLRFVGPLLLPDRDRSEEHTSELQSRETISYAVFCLKKKKTY